MRSTSRALAVFSLTAALGGCVRESVVDDIGEVEFIELGELKSLMASGPLYGEFVTVVSGNQRVSRELRMEGILEERGQKMVVFTTPYYIAAGMSGSPVYVKAADGKTKLVGALAYFLSPGAGRQWGGISPIGEMKREAQAVASGAAPAVPGPVFYQGKTLVPIALGASAVPEGVFGSNGLDTRTSEMLRSNKFMVTRESAASQEVQTTYNRPLQPGMPIVVDLLEWQDPSGKSSAISAMGTVTYVSKDGVIYAFGHPFLRARKVRYRFRTCAVLGTIESTLVSYKLPSETSPVLGVISYDGTYGIYGRINRQDTTATHPISITFKHNGGMAAQYKVLLAQTPMMPVLFSMAFQMLGEMVDAPLGGQSSMTDLNLSIPLNDAQPLEYSGTYTSSRFQFGPRVIYRSSYENAYEDLLSRMYMPLSASTFDFKIENVSADFNFSESTKPNLKLAALSFPEKVKFGTVPELTLLLVSEDNKTVMTRIVPAKIDWSQVEEPAYTADTKDTDKQAEKIVGGSVSVYTADQYGSFLTPNEAGREFPAHFLNAKDFLSYFNRFLARNNKVLFARVGLRKRSGIGESSQATAKFVIPNGGQARGGWFVSGKGLSERKTTVRREDTVAVTLDMPVPPGGYIIAPTSKILSFEVVK